MAGKKKILIVEDEKSLLEALKRKFSSEKFAVFEAKNGEEGLEMALKEHPDLILLDIVMPKMDGITVLGKLREDSWGKDAKVIILSNLSDATKVSEASKQGSFDYLVKSDWRIEDVVKKAKEILKM
ncbi:response regulator [Candidatus Parcubacteria bacterium]|jgi:two-component system, OmpR family, alkaline phosphatase synthesis response regulator PhoP|nr:response regulator [Candidatus Parcubacteria bacterium]MBT3949154.1 response regulator [Candidatus Parcubacteria bacterium]